MREDRLDPAKPYSVLVYRGKPLPPWSSRAVHTVRKSGRAYYAVVTTDEKLTPLGGVVPGRSATTEPTVSDVDIPRMRRLLADSRDFSVPPGQELDKGHNKGKEESSCKRQRLGMGRQV